MRIVVHSSNLELDFVRDPLSRAFRKGRLYLTFPLF
jgi:hypothetical protein